ncbi:hypothetical protein [Streptomyces hirsutus]|uniref:hypothetical protein n=1 Tax=Streptomyces hirsutus TaxID=35620 RepID=UPI0036A58D09
MSTVATAADWAWCGGIGVGAWTVIAVLVKVAVDTPAPARPAPPATVQPPAPSEPFPVTPPCPTSRPSTARHAAGPAVADTVALTRVPSYRPRHSKGPAAGKIPTPSGGGR